ncbi:xyloglucan galactosyltransferase KATAMARI1 homolog [Zingiber officinale]|uniref:Exostosin GT47 domain-containing protein n=1 Tax=Zingiber officinale TaxID=94328 RepID=A0A8J5FRX8_ZINOF|nr:xyloglucan galactosyltransferase KATAMARI1 homolog [Zingiber officinale]KAG6493943.1 hypothetical protein ZIOFF_048949 [Zingiber officinale]
MDRQQSRKYPMSIGKKDTARLLIHHLSLGGGVDTVRRMFYVVVVSLVLCFLLLLPGEVSSPAGTALTSSGCDGRYIFVQELPARFNVDLLRNCCVFSRWAGDACHLADNGGFGRGLGGDWYATDQFTLELIFHSRMRQYECLTDDPDRAAAVFVPFYPGIEMGHHLWGSNVSVRDAAPLELAQWLRSRPEWTKMGGRDHFMVAGRITWDFRRWTEDGDWGSKLLLLPELKSMTTLIIESSPWHRNDMAIPYPTYFHPSTVAELTAWQNRVLKQSRPWLFSFAGAPRWRPPNSTASLRDLSIEQCRASARCKLLDCAGERAGSCFSPRRIMALFESSVFCLQPVGDSPTRRSTFDAMVAGCVPVFFHPGSAYTQYAWHLPRDYRRYSVFLPEEVVRQGNESIELALRKITAEEVAAMRKEVVGMLPRLVYGDRRRGAAEFDDAFDVAVEKVIERVQKQRKQITEGTADAVAEEKYTWKQSLVSTNLGEDEWDHYFSHWG